MREVSNTDHHSIMLFIYYRCLAVGIQVDVRQNIMEDGSALFSRDNVPPHHEKIFQEL